MLKVCSHLTMDTAQPLRTNSQFYTEPTMVEFSVKLICMKFSVSSTNLIIIVNVTGNKVYIQYKTKYQQKQTKSSEKLKVTVLHTHITKASFAHI